MATLSAIDRGWVMREYSFYYLNQQSQIQSTKITYCADDLDALKFAKQLDAPADIEIWQGTRLVTRLNARSNSPQGARRISDTKHA